MAFEVGAITGKFQLKDEWTKPQFQIYDSINKTLSKISEVPGKVSAAASKSASAVKNTSNTLNGLNDRVTRLNNLLGKSQIDSKRFQTLRSEIEKTQKTIDSAAKSSSGSSLFSNIATGAGVAGLLTATGSLIKSAAKAGMEYEKLFTSFEVFLGSASKATQVLAQLTQFSVVTPFEPEQVNQAGKALLAFGFSAEQLIPTLSMVGDVAAATGKDFNELAVIYGKARTAGTLYAEDINQLTEAGVPIIQELSKVMKVNEGQIKKLGSEGKIHFAELEKAFASMTSEGGRFFGMMDKQSKTTAGLLSTLSGNVDLIMKAFGTGLNESLRPVVQMLITITDKWVTLLNATQQARDASVAFASIQKENIPQAIALMEGLSLTTDLTAKEFNVLRKNLANAGIELKDFASPGNFGKIKIETEAINKAIGQLKENLNATAKTTPEKPLLNLGSGSGKAKQSIDQLIDSIIKLDSASNKELNWKISTSDIQSANQMAAKLKEMGAIITQVRSGDTKGGIKTTLDIRMPDGKPISKAALQLAMDQLDPKLKAKVEVETNVSESGGTGDPMTDMIKQAVENIKKVINDLVNETFNMIIQRLNNKLQNIQQKMKIFDTFSQVMIAKEKQRNEEELASFTKAQDAELELFKKNLDEKTQLEKDAINDRVSALTEEYIQRKTLQDTEFASKKAQLDAEYQALVANEMAKYDAHAAIIQQQAVDKEQAQIAEVLSEQDRKDLLASLEKQYNDKLLSLTSEKNEADKVLEEQSNLAKEEEQKKADEKIIQLEKYKADQIAAAEAAKEDRIFRKQEEIKAKEKESNRKVALLKYGFDVAALEVSKQIARAQATMQFAQGIMGAVSKAGETFGASLALIPLINSTYNLSMAAINSQFVVPPAELFLATGGMIVPGIGNTDTVPARLTPGEMVVDKSTTQGLQEMVSNGRLDKNAIININFMAGAIQNGGQMGSREMDQLSIAIQRRLERNYTGR